MRKKVQRLKSCQQVKANVPNLNTSAAQGLILGDSDVPRFV